MRCFGRRRGHSLSVAAVRAAQLLAVRLEDGSLHSPGMHNAVIGQREMPYEAIASIKEMNKKHLYKIRK